MNYSEWNKLSNEQKQVVHWRHHPHVRTAKIFTILVALLLGVFLLSVFRNKRIHVNRKPNKLEAFAAAKIFVNNHLNQSSTSVFPKNSFIANIDTSHNSYEISSTVSAQDSSGKMQLNSWSIKLAYKGGDWANPESWKVLELNIHPQTQN